MLLASGLQHGHIINHVSTVHTINTINMINMINMINTINVTKTQREKPTRACEAGLAVHAASIILDKLMNSLQSVLMANMIFFQPAHHLVIIQ